MNLLHANLTTKTRARRIRNGLTIIEVLTSIVVAMIGVFGVMILIPFAVKQAKTGLDSDASVMVGRNAYAQFEIAGYRAPTNWARDLGGGATRYSPFSPGSTETAEIFSIDPLGIMENGSSYAAANFPFNRPVSSTYPANLEIEAVNLYTADGTVMDVAVARRMFRSADDLVFGEAADELLGPEQVFDQGASGSLRRQAIGRLSWSAIVVPFKTDPALPSPTRRWSYKMYILVYKDRVTQISAAPDPNDQMLTAIVTNPNGPQSPVSNVVIDATAVQGFVNRDDWVMLINLDPNAEPGFDRQLAFYRVVSAADDASGAILTLDGPDFVFDDGSGTLETHVVHLNSVVGVYERTFTPEYESNWNVSF